MMRKQKLAVLAALMIAPLAGCTSITEPVQMGEDTYMIALGARGGFTTNDELLAQSIKEAGKFCASKGRRIEVEQTSSSGVQMWTPQSNKVIFRCLPKEGRKTPST